MSVKLATHSSAPPEATIKRLDEAISIHVKDFLDEQGLIKTGELREYLLSQGFKLGSISPRISAITYPTVFHGRRSLTPPPEHMVRRPPTYQTSPASLEPPTPAPEVARDIIITSDNKRRPSAIRPKGFIFNHMKEMMDTGEYDVGTDHFDGPMLCRDVCHGLGISRSHAHLNLARFGSSTERPGIWLKHSDPIVPRLGRPKKIKASRSRITHEQARLAKPHEPVVRGRQSSQMMPLEDAELLQKLHEVLMAMSKRPSKVSMKSMAVYYVEAILGA